jgi:hypothetical protein
MAFQITEFQYKEYLGHLAAWFGKSIGSPGGTVKISEMIDSVVPDEKKRDRYKAVLLIALKCYGSEIDPLAVRKIVCWKDAAGKPGLIEADVEGGRPLTLDLSPIGERGGENRT